MVTTRFHFLLLPIAIAAIALAACGGDSPGDSGSTKADFREAALKHARCMREHGVDVPDPKFGPGGAVTMEMRGARGTSSRCSGPRRPAGSTSRPCGRLSCQRRSSRSSARTR